MEYLNLVIPASWSSLTQKQLFYIFNVIAAGYNSIEVCTLALMRFNGIDVLDSVEPGIHRVKKDGVEYKVSSTDIAELLSSIKWLTEIPTYPVRLDKIRGHRALPADLQGVQLEKFIMCDNLYQGYLETHKPELLQEMACILYEVPLSEQISFRLTTAQEVSIFYWWAGLKNYFSNVFSNVLKSATTDEDEGLGKSLFKRLQDSMNNMIRALTKGDVTKEKEVLAIDVWRALTELDAQAREYEELQRKTRS